MRLLHHPVRGVLLALATPPQLLLLADVEEEFDDDGVGTCQQFFKGVDLALSSFPDVLGNQAVHSLDQHALVVGAIEDADHSQSRSDTMRAPQEVVGELFSGRHGKWRDHYALWIEAAHHVSDYAVLAARVAPRSDLGQ
jgi:hypothetical protein